MIEKRKWTNSSPRDYKERFEFKLTVGDIIICATISDNHLHIGTTLVCKAATLVILIGGLALAVGLADHFAVGIVY